ncbi:MAG: nucleotidyltransferase family protein [Bacteroidota bacterium]
MDRKDAIEIVQKYKDILLNYFNIESVYLYGSYAKSTQHQDSDIDVAIIVDEISGDYFEIHPLLWKLRRKIDERIEPFLIVKSEDKTGFINEIKNTGIAV